MPSSSKVSLEKTEAIAAKSPAARARETPHPNMGTGDLGTKPLPISSRRTKYACAKRQTPSSIGALAHEISAIVIIIIITRFLLIYT